MRGNRETEILAKTFKDSLTVYRKVPHKNPETRETTEKEEAVYENIRCAFSSAGNSNPEKEEFHSKKQMKAVLFTEPYVVMLDNDRAVVITGTGQKFEGITGSTFPYISHGETPFSIEGMT